jgi:hypothetical protein
MAGTSPAMMEKLYDKRFVAFVEMNHRRPNSFSISASFNST